MAPGRPIPLVDLVKAVASQLIVAHHFVLYGAMSDAVAPLLGRLGDWLVNDARLAVQCFLVVGGFLAVRSLRGGMALLDEMTLAARAKCWVTLVARRLQRLVPPLWVALGLALLAAVFARALSDHPSIPRAPSVGQMLGHLLLLQDILGLEALSSGIWYVAIDLQLYAVTAALCLLPGMLGLWAGVALFLGSLLVFNRDASLDAWAPYFFCAYGLGAAAWLVRSWQPQWRAARPLAVMAVVAVVMAGLAIEWRIRIALALMTACLLLLPAPARAVPATSRLVPWLAAISYPVFLLHYPVLLAVDALYDRFWPGQAVPAVAGLLLAWCITLWLSEEMRRRVGS